MNLSGIIAISGKGGLYTVAGQSKNNVIVESLIDGKKFPAFSSNRISALEDISIYTYEGDELLADIFKVIFDKEKKRLTQYNSSSDFSAKVVEEMIASQ